MRILETFVLGKRPDPELCEDRIVVTDHYAAVIDGATDISGATFNGRSGGRFAADTLAAAIENLPGEATARDAVDHLTTALDRAIRTAVANGTPVYRPSAQLVIYSASRHEIWRVGDASFIVDGTPHPGSKLIDEVTLAYRRAWTESLLLQGADPEELRREDPGLAAAWSLIRMQEPFANITGSMYAYGVLNGTPVPDQHIEVTSTRTAREIVLASDGYPHLPPTLQEAEDALARDLATDPLGLDPATAKRAHRPGWNSFDDRAWLRLTP